jgi:hypothetical protein
VPHQTANGAVDGRIEHSPGVAARAKAIWLEVCKSMPALRTSRTPMILDVSFDPAMIPPASENQRFDQSRADHRRGAVSPLREAKMSSVGLDGQSAAQRYHLEDYHPAPSQAAGPAGAVGGVQQCAGRS